MTANTGVKYPLCVEWTTEVPFDDTPRKSTSMSFCDSTWFFELKCGPGFPDNFSLYLRNINSEELLLDQPLYVTTSALDDAQKFSKVLTEQKHFQNTNIPIWVKARKEVLSEIPSIYKKGKMKIMCVFHGIESGINKTQVSTENTLNSVSANLQILSRDFSTFLKDETFSDVKLQCADRTFSAHKSVLAARSEVFAAMFRNQMAEKVSGRVLIKDVDPEVLELLLVYMYSAELLDLCEETAHRLYEAADKYAVHGLRQACFDWMVKHQTTDSCLDLLVLAEQHSDDIFKEAVVCFVAEHLADLCIESWSTFRKKYPLLVLPVLEKRFEDSMPRAAKGAK